MRYDLRDAHAAIEWGRAQMVVLAGRIRVWEDENVKIREVDVNRCPGRVAIVAYSDEPLPAIVNAEVGTIIGSFRSALDLLAWALAGRKSIVQRDAHERSIFFPVFRSRAALDDKKGGISKLLWLAPGDMSKIATLQPYDGGNDHLWALHRLDITRKHRRLIAAVVHPRVTYMLGRAVSAPTLSQSNDLKLENSPVVAEFSHGVGRPEVGMTIDVTFDELGLNVYRRPVLPTLGEFAELATSIISDFDGLP